MIPLIIGVSVIAYLLWDQYHPQAIDNIAWTRHIVIWTGIALVLLVVRHLAYAARLKVLSDGDFSWSKSIELIFIWEFSSSVSPTSLGGSIVAFFMLAQERISAARTATIVIYTIILDTLFFMVGMPLLYWIYGANVIRPEISSFFDSGGWGWTVLALTISMSAYGMFFYYGMFVDPRRLKQLLMWLTKFKWTRRWRDDATQIGDELILSSHDITGKKPWWHVKLFAFTSTAWICRFLILNALIIAFVPSTSLSAWTQGLLYGRSEYMFMIMAFSPTPGSAGLAEIVFEGFLSDFVPVGLAILIAFIWRLVTYYTYLVAGVLVIPNWIRKVISRRIALRQSKLSGEHQ